MKPLILSMILSLCVFSECLETLQSTPKGLELEIDTLVNSYLEAYKIPGVVVLVGHRESISFHKAYGSIDGKMKMPKDAIFDVASITKLFSATALLKSLEKNKLPFEGRVSLALKEYQRSETAELRFEDLLRHESGLRPSMHSSFYRLNTKDAWSAILATDPEFKYGEFKYSDLNYLVLGQALEKLEGIKLDQAVKSLILEPLKLESTSFRPMKNLPSCKEKCVPTSTNYSLGQVHDPTSRHLGGVAGHAGIFSSANDLAKFASMFLEGGKSCNKRVISNAQVNSMTVKTPNSSRGLGFDISSRYSKKPSGDFFSKGISYGHTGYTGTSIWIDPTIDTYLIVLSNSVYAKDWKRAKKGYLKLINELATSVGGAYSF